MIRDYQAIMKTWFPKGKQRIIPTYGKHEGVKLVGILDYETGHVYVEEHKKYDAGVFLQFLKNVLSQYQDGKIVIILDNAKIHHAKLLREFLAENREHLELVFLPPYSPNLNKIEELWGWLKDSVINNVFFHSREEIQKAVQKFIDWITTVPLLQKISVFPASSSNCPALHSHNLQTAFPWQPDYVLHDIHQTHCNRKSGLQT